MPPYTSLLVLVLAASIVTPVLSAEAAQPLYDTLYLGGKNEERFSSHFRPLEKRITMSNLKKVYFGVSGFLLTALAVDGIYLYTLTAGKKLKGDATNTSIPTGQSNSTGAVTARRNERPFGRGLPIDISETRSFSDKSDQKRRTSQQLDLLSRTELGEALSLISRMLREDELD